MLKAIALGSLAGASTLNCLSSLPQSEIVALFFIVGLLIIVLSCFSNLKKWRRGCFFFFSLILGFSWTHHCAKEKLAWHLPSEDVQQIVEIKGKIVGMSQRFEDSLRFDVELLYYKGKPISQKNIKIRLMHSKAPIQFNQGDTIHAEVKLLPPWRLANPGTFDQEKQLFIEGIRATGKIIKLLHHQEIDKPSLSRLRQRLSKRIGELMGNKPFVGVIQATTLGIYKNISQSQWQVFHATGTTHAIAISGMHVSFIATVFGSAAAVLVKRFVQLTLIFPASCYGAMLSMVGAVLYSALAGFSIPTQRALVMIIVASLALLKRQPPLSWDSLALAWLGIAVLDPLSTLQMGFWLSFGCVAALIYGNSHVVKKGFWRKWVLPQVIVFVGIFPLCSFFFQQISLLSPLANMIALPVIDLVVVPFSLIGLGLMGFSESLAILCFKVAHQALALIWILLEKISHLPYAVWWQGKIPTTHLLLSFLAALFLLAPKGIPGRKWSWVGFLPMIFYQPKEIAHGEFNFTLLDVGQGLAAVIQTRHHSLLYDAGPMYGAAADCGQRVIIPFLRNAHIHRLDKVVISHGDLDHRAGLKSLVFFPMGELISSEPKRLPIPSHQCFAGGKWEWDGVTFSLLSPFSLDQTKRNNLSCVLSVSNGYQRVLLTGDIEEKAERILLNNQKDLKSTILVVPHHGSLTSSSLAFIEAVSPVYALYPAGRGNQYKFPKPVVLERYESLGIKNLVVYETGALLFHLKQSNELTPPIQWRETSRRYWHEK